MWDWALGIIPHTGDSQNSKKQKSENWYELMLVLYSTGRPSSKKELFQMEETINQEP